MESKIRVRFAPSPSCSKLKRQPALEGSKVSEDEQNIIVDYATLDSFHRSIGPVLTLAQFFAILPVCGVLNADPRLLKFEWRRFRVLWTIFCLVISSLNLSFYINMIIIPGINAKNIIGVVFFSCGITSCIMFLCFAYKWPKLMRIWTNTEMIFMLPPYKTPKWTLRVRNRLAATIVLSLALIEHLMYNMSSVYNFVIKAKMCNVSYELNYKGFMTESYGQFFSFIPYNIATGMLYMYCNIAFTFIWNYMDLFIMMISLSIAIRYEQINTRISELSKKNTCEEQWSEVRQHYMEMCDLLELVDGIISPLTLLSSANNLYFICCQLLYIFNKQRFNINYIYYWFSLFYLIGRTGLVFLCAASINDESKKTIYALRSIPTKRWCIEVERIVEYMATQCVSLSGMNFFYMTRGLVLGMRVSVAMCYLLQYNCLLMAGTIVTYELVLLQLDEPNRVSELPPLCN